MRESNGWGRDMIRGDGFNSFGHDVLMKYLESNKVTHLIRAHEICEVGFHIHRHVTLIMNYFNIFLSNAVLQFFLQQTINLNAILQPH